MGHKPDERQKEKAFDCYIKKVLKYAARNYQKQKKLRSEREAAISEITRTQLMKLAATDRYFSDEYSFDVLDWKIGVTDAGLGEAMAVLPDDRREIILMYYFLDMNDREISKQLNLKNSTVAYRRNGTLKMLRGLLEENAYV